MILALFGLFAGIAVASAAMVALAREVYRAAFALLGTIIGVAGLVALIGSPAVASLLVLIYVGGVFVLFVFAILVTDLPPASVFRAGVGARAAAVAAATGFAAVLLVAAVRSPRLTGGGGPAEGAGAGARQIGLSFLTDNLLTFEAVSILLLAGIVAAVVVIRKEIPE